MSDLPSGWIETTIGEACEVIQGQSPPGESYNDEGTGTPFLQGKAEFGELRPTFVKWTTAPKKMAHPDDILISIRAPVGPTNLAPADCSIGRGLAAVRPRCGTSTMFVLYALRATAEILAAKGTGTTFTAVSGAVLRAHTLPLPPLAEQQRIVEAIEEQFSRLDAGVASLQRAKRNIARMRASVLSAAVDGRLVEPEGGWATVRVRDVALSIDYGSSARASTELSDGMPMLRMGNIVDGRIDYQQLKFVPRNHPDATKCSLVPGDVLFNRTNSPELVGKTAVFDGKRGPAVFASYLVRVRVTDAVEPSFLAACINSAQGRSYIASVRTQQVGQANVNASKLAAMPIPLPPLGEQHRIVEEMDRQFSILDAMEATVDAGLARAERLRQAILREAFAGRLVPQDLADEPASAFLERIQSGRTKT